MMMLVMLRILVSGSHSKGVANGGGGEENEDKKITMQTMVMTTRVV